MVSPSWHLEMATADAKLQQKRAMQVCPPCLERFDTPVEKRLWRNARDRIGIQSYQVAIKWLLDSSG